MKTTQSIKCILIICTLYLLSIFTSCVKTLDPSDSPVNSSTGEATIGIAGGTISVGDETSAIYGASIEIPKGALDEQIEIKIISGNNNLILDGENIPTIDFLPAGIEFKEPVSIGIPWSSNDQTAAASAVYYLDNEKAIIEELQIERIDLENKITYGIITHFSTYFNRNRFVSIDYSFTKNNNRIVGALNLYTPLSQISPVLTTSPYANAEEIIINNNGLENCFAEIRFDLTAKYMPVDYYFTNVANQTFYIKYQENNNLWDIWVYRVNGIVYTESNPIVEIFHKTGIPYYSFLNDWMTGFPIVAKFTDDCFYRGSSSFENDAQLILSTGWTLVNKTRHEGRAEMWTWNYGSRSQIKKMNEIMNSNGDQNNNNILDEFEEVNSPPSIPINPQPSNNASNVSVNSGLSWSCSDPDGDNLYYNIYFGTNANPAYLESSQTNSFSLSTLEYSTTYYWHIVALDTDGHLSTSPTWQFTTESTPVPGCNGINSIDYGGQTYHTVEINDQCWLIENMNIGTMIDGSINQSDNATLEKYCYNNDPAQCSEFGGLYQLEEAMQYSTNEGAQGICPSGWHIPSHNDWKILEGTVDSQYGVGDPIWDLTFERGFDAGKKLKSTSGWFIGGNGTDVFGFTVLPGGVKYEGGIFNEKTAAGYFWTSNYRVRMFDFQDDKIANIWLTHESSISVRCLKD